MPFIGLRYILSTQNFLVFSSSFSFGHEKIFNIVKYFSAPFVICNVFSL